VATDYRNSNAGSHEPHHELSDIWARPVLFFAIGLAILIIVTFITMKSLFTFLDEEANRSDPELSGVAAQRPQLPPLPRLESAPVSARKQFFENEKEIIESYGWVDQKQGVARIPVARAMELVAERGMPLWTQSEAKIGHEMTGKQNVNKVSTHEPEK
jgi:hypothetical protein